MNTDGTPVPSDYPPLKVRPDAVYSFEDTDFYHVGSIARDITRDPAAFEFGTVPTALLAPQVKREGNVDQGYVDGMSDRDMLRPLIMIRYPDGAARLIDGYHRAAKALEIGWPSLVTYVLPVEQAARYKVTAAKR